MSTSTPNSQPQPQLQVKSEPADTTASDAMSKPTSPIDWNEQTMISSLARLETIQEQLDSLRQTMPLLVRSLTKPHHTPEDLFKDFRNVTVQTQKKLISVKATWESKETKGIFERVKARSTEKVVVDLEDIKKVPVYGWIEEIEGRRNKRKFKGEDEVVDEEGVNKLVDEEGVNKLVDEYKARHEGIEAEYKDDTIKIAYKAAGNIPLTFSVTKRLKGTHSSYEVQGPTRVDNASSTDKLFDAIDRCLEDGSKLNDLEQTLEMIAAYKDLRTTKCDVCKELLGKGGLTPAARRSKTVKGPDGAETQKWVSIHEGCLLS
ncbi:mediator complex subunit med27 [Venturia nashicola]|uniref:Mediator complex subunit med27 n=1 Tax=Venturia nashicola TaxID=86259 RepID=A0A4Z1P9Q7_9PEZI|nr:mediator complex subunit med27 [Venturia nashicola]